MMKKLLLLTAVLLAGIASTTQAQTAKPRTHSSEKPSKDYIMMKNGKMMMSMDGNLMPMTSDMTMSDGSVGMTDGTYHMKDGTTMKMKEGQRMMMDGKMMKGNMMKGGKMGSMHHMKM